MGRLAVRRHLTLLLLFGFISLPTKAVAQKEMIPAATSLFAASVNPASEYGRANGRGKLIQKLSLYCHEIDLLLPTNTPSEDAWVEAENKPTANAEKLMRVISSVEYSRHELKAVFSHCGEITDELKPARQEIAHETAALIRLARNFNNDMGRDAVRVGLNPDMLGFDLFFVMRKALMNAALRALEGQ
jgi:hypothetical protein